MLTNTADERGSSGGIQLYFRLRSSNTSTADAADFAIKKTSAREVVFMVPVSRLELPTHALRMRCSTN